MKITNPVINKSIDYILNHINDDISIEDVANYCNFSKYHFSRMFKAETGISIYSLIKSLKIDQSAVSLKIEKDRSITYIGNTFGYSSSNYSTAFNREFHLSPADYRKSLNTVKTANPFYTREMVNFKSYEHYKNNITIKNFDNFQVIYERHIGNYSEIGSNWYNIMERYKSIIKGNTLFIEKSYNDPSISAFNKSIYDLCLTIDDDMDSENILTLTGGKFAVYRFDGLVNDIFGIFQGMFNVWLPNSEYERNSPYVLGIYRKVNFKDNQVVMDLCIPIK